MVALNGNIFSSLTAIIMLAQTAHSLKVAVLGSGIAGSTAARTLADRGVQVTVFEAGFGIGGRTSTRQTRDELRYQFDHGAQYISKPKSDDFRDALGRWKADGWVRDWSGGRFLTADGIHVREDEKKDRLVGYPAMHSICRNMLHHENIKVKLHTRANAARNGEDERWELIDDKSKQSLGTFDWLIASDRNSAAHFRRDLKAADVEEFTMGTRKINSVKSLTAMVVFEKSLGPDIDGVQFAGNDPKHGSLGWAARDSSKPGRERDDGRECWVLQSRPDAARELLRGKKKVSDIREMAKDVLVEDFLACFPSLAGDERMELPSVVTAIGHRWGAAFPIPSLQFTEMESQMIGTRKFVACGDYFGTLSGRIEGAYLSGVSAADQLCGEVQISSP